MITRNFYCDTCRVEFAITVEPGKPEEVIKREFPDSIEWLDKLDKVNVIGKMECPVCGEPLNCL